MSNLILTTIFTILTLSLNAQLSITFETVTGELFPCNYGKVAVNLNGDIDLTEVDNCQYSTDFSNVQEGSNFLSVRSELFPGANLTTFDLVLFAQHLLGMNEFTSYAQAIAADVDSDAVISTDDIILLRQLLLFEVIELEKSVKICSPDLLSEPFTGFELRSDHTVYAFDKDEVQDGLDNDVLIIKVGNLD